MQLSVSMSQQPTPSPSDAPLHGDDADAVGPLIARGEKRLDKLQELSGLGMEMARELVRRTVNAPDDDTSAPAPRHDPAESFARLSRAIRLTIAFEARLDKELSAWRAGVPPCAPRRQASAPAPSKPQSQAQTGTQPQPKSPDPAAPAADPGWYRTLLPRNYPSAHRNKIREAVWSAMNITITDLREAHEKLDDLYEWLGEGERYDEFVELPFKEAVAAICDDLGLKPDWNRWNGEGFTQPPPGAPRRQWQNVWQPRLRPPKHLRRR
jgi:hypothetical protein